jgi:hypothetical protein
MMLEAASTYTIIQNTKYGHMILGKYRLSEGICVLQHGFSSLRD